MSPNFPFWELEPHFQTYSLVFSNEKENLYPFFLKNGELQIQSLTRTIDSILTKLLPLNLYMFEM